MQLYGVVSVDRINKHMSQPLVEPVEPFACWKSPLQDDHALTAE